MPTSDAGGEHAAIDVRLGALEDVTGDVQRRVGAIEVDLAGLKGRLWGIAAILTLAIPLLGKLLDKVLPP